VPYPAPKQSEAQRRTALYAAKSIKRQIEKLVDRILESSQPRTIAIYEKELDRLDRQKNPHSRRYGELQSQKCRFRAELRSSL